MEWRPKRNLAVWALLPIGILLVGLVISVLDGLAGHAIWLSEIGIRTVLAGLVLAVTISALVFIIVWLYGVATLRYHLDRNQIELCWAPLRQVIPLPAITEIAPRRAERRTKRFRGLRLLGCQFGPGEIEHLGRVWFCATRPAKDQWVIVTPSLSYILTPAEAEGFLKAYRERRALGPTRDVPQKAIWPHWLSWPIWRDGGTLGLSGAGIGLNAFLFAHVGVHYSRLGASLAGGPESAFDLPIIGWLTLLFNQGLGLILYRARHRFGTHLLFVATLGVQVLLWASVLRMMPAGEAMRFAYWMLAAFGISGLIAWVGYRKGALAPSGVLGAILVGTAIVGFGGWTWGVLMIAFFASSSFFSRHQGKKQARLADTFAKGSRRDLGQAMANGGLGALLAIASHFGPGAVWMNAFVGAMSAVNADTWATEIGILSKKRPHLITTGKRVPAGTSGGVSMLGLFASFLGAAFIGLLAAQLRAVEALLAGQGLPDGFMDVAFIGLVSGVIGSLGDSLLGATAQGIYYCDHCAKETESTLHRCGRTTRHLRGWKWLNNDRVNWISSALGALVALGTALLLSR